MNKKISIILIVIAICLLGNYYYRQHNIKNTEVETKTDAERFAADYTLVGEDNVFIYKNIEDIKDILEHGTGVVFFGFSSCPWCQQYAVYLNETAKSVGLDKIYYYDIKEDRENNTDNYQAILSLLGDDIQYDDEGKARIFVPDVTIVKEGTILGRDYETSKDTGGFDNPSDYWTEKKVKALKTKLSKLMSQVNTTTCTDCNAK